MKSLNTKELAQLLNKCWMTHDGMWFLHSLQECGIEKTNKINKAAIRSLAPIEIKRLQEACGIGEVNGMQDLKDLFAAAQEVFIPDFMEYELSFPANNRMNMDIQKCFAHVGITRIGAIEAYECGIFHRIESWFDALGISYDVEPKVLHCMMHTDGVCRREYEFSF
jgi:hypothetical protein